MTRRTQAEWCELIEQQRESGLTAAEFCRRNAVNAKYFSLRKQKLKQEAGSFVRVSPRVSRPSPVAATGIKVRVVELEIPCSAVAETLTLLLDRLGR
jgi:hypothetical protein